MALTDPMPSVWPLELVIAGLPPTNAADRRSPWAYHTLAKRWQARVVGAVLETLGRWPAQPLERAHVTIVRCSNREPDFDGLVAGGKHLLDGLVKAGVIADDRMSVIGAPEYLWEKIGPGKGHVRIRVEAVGEDAAA